ncbi:MAG: hypothetical protein WCV85_04630 [Patescibacteria group bacterium]|jgi:hypothetical protein
MPEGMLGNLSLAETQGPMRDLEQKLAGPNGRMWLEALKKFLRGEKKLAPNDATTDKEILVCTLVKVDRSIKPYYSDWMKKVLHPKLESTGLADYDITKDVWLWQHDEQQYGVVTGQVIYDFLRKNKMLESCGNLQDALAIQKLGVTTFRKAFSNDTVYFWKSVVQNLDGLSVPYLCVNGGIVVLRWSWLGDDWDDDGSAFRFKIKS